MILPALPYKGSSNMGLALQKVGTEQHPEGDDIASHSHAYMAQYAALH
jgi:hypothetical protein